MNFRFIFSLIILLTIIAVLILKIVNSSLDMLTDIILIVSGGITSVYSLYKSSFKLQLLKRRLFYRQKKVYWSLSAKLVLEVNHNSIIENILKLLKDKYKDIRILNKGINYLDIHIKEISSLSFNFFHLEDNKVELDLRILPFKENYFGFKDVITEFSNLIEIIKEKHILRDNAYTIRLEFMEFNQNPYYKFLKPYFSEANLNDLTMNVRIKDTNNVQILIGKDSFTFDFSSLPNAQKEIEKTLQLSVKV
ncbi:MAG: hypothetical protein ACOCV1_07135 [Bacillota bacterium]